MFKCTYLHYFLFIQLLIMSLNVLLCCRSWLFLLQRSCTRPEPSSWLCQVFDSVNQHTLVATLAGLKIAESALSWLPVYLCERIYQTSLSSFLSTLSIFSSTILLGWVLAPTFFCLYNSLNAVSTSPFLPPLQAWMLLFFLPSDTDAEYSTSPDSFSYLSSHQLSMTQTELLFFLENQSPCKISRHHQQQRDDSFPLCSLCWCSSAQPTVTQGANNMTVIPSWLWSRNTLISKTHHPNLTCTKVFHTSNSAT